MLALEPVPAREFLAGLGQTLPRPRAIIVASAHWESEAPLLGAAVRNDTIHDFYGFPAALHALSYPAPGDPKLAVQAKALLDKAGLDQAGLAAELDPIYGLDHGAWVPLLLMYPDADIPVFQLSIQTWRGPAHHLALGAALAALRAQDILLIGSGSFTHDLRRLDRRGPNAPEQPDVAEFAAWMDRAILARDTKALLAYRTRAPHGAAQHPTEEHLMPLFFALGAGGPATRLHASTTYGALRMDAYSFA